MHVIDEASPLHGLGPEALARVEGELTVTVSGIDETSLQPVYARRTYEADRVVWGARLADVLSEEAGGDLLLDLRKFHELVPTASTAAFPHPSKPA